MSETLRENLPIRAAKRHPLKPISTTIDETCRITGLGRSTVYELIGQGNEVDPGNWTGG
jgi:hypothetical protein